MCVIGGLLVHTYHFSFNSKKQTENDGARVIITTAIEGLQTGAFKKSCITKGSKRSARMQAAENDEGDGAAPNEASSTSNDDGTDAVNAAGSEHATAPIQLVRVKQEIQSDVEDGGVESVTDEQSVADAAKQAEQEKMEKKYKKANKIKFSMLVKTLEELWETKKSAKRRWSNEEKLEKLLPKRLLRHLEGGDPYPILRLIMPEIDTSRPNLGMQEKAIAKAWSQALGT
jgi:hypothetical protein